MDGFQSANGKEIKFWKTKWVGNDTLENKHHKIFKLAQKDLSVDNIGFWVEEEWRWDFRWKRP